MSTIERGQFIRDLSQQRINVDAKNPSPEAQALKDAGVQQADLDRIAGSDHVISGDTELGQLYDKLVQLQNDAPRSERSEGNASRAQQVYDRLRQEDTPFEFRSPIRLDFGSGRARTTGIFGESLLRPPTLPVSDSSYVRTLGRSQAAQLDAAAQRNTTGPEAAAQRSIQSLTDNTVRTIEGLEQQRDAAPAGSVRRNELDAQIKHEVTRFENNVASEMATARQRPAPNASDPNQQSQLPLPPILRDAADRGGVPLPGGSGAVMPRTGSPYGVDLKFKF